MPQLPWTPWHQVMHIRDDLRSGELSLAAFAADLYDVAMQKGRRPIYEDPAQFFALTYPTYTLRELTRDVVLLVADPAALPDLPAVHEFVQHIGLATQSSGLPLPQARVALLPFNKLDVEKGMQVRGPAGELRWLKHPWSVIAFQIAGADGRAQPADASSLTAANARAGDAASQPPGANTPSAAPPAAHPRVAPPLPPRPAPAAALSFLRRSTAPARSAPIAPDLPDRTGTRGNLLLAASIGDPIADACLLDDD